MKSFLLVFLASLLLITLSIKLKSKSLTPIDEVDFNNSNDFRVLASPAQSNVIQILGGSDFVNATTPLNETFTVSIEGYSENDGNWFISNKDALSEYLTPINIEDDGLSTKFTPDEFSTETSDKIGAVAFEFKAIKATTEPIELRFELKHPYDPIPIRTILVIISIE